MWRCSTHLLRRWGGAGTALSGTGVAHVGGRWASVGPLETCAWPQAAGGRRWRSDGRQGGNCQWCMAPAMFRSHRQPVVLIPLGRKREMSRYSRARKTRKGKEEGGPDFKQVWQFISSDNGRRQQHSRSSWLPSKWKLWAAGTVGVVLFAPGLIWGAFSVIGIGAVLAILTVRYFHVIFPKFVDLMVRHFGEKADMEHFEQFVRQHYTQNSQQEQQGPRGHYRRSHRDHVVDEDDDDFEIITDTQRAKEAARKRWQRANKENVQEGSYRSKR